LVALLLWVETEIEDDDDDVEEGADITSDSPVETLVSLPLVEFHTERGNDGGGGLFFGETADVLISHLWGMSDLAWRP
jgi:hypothetical protein